MHIEDTDLRHMLESTVQTVVEQISVELGETVRRELSTSFSRILLQGEFYKHISLELQNGLRSIYQEISSASGEPPCPEHETRQLLSETTDQLDAVVQATERATSEIMDIIERQLDSLQGVSTCANQLADADPAASETLRSHSQRLSDDLMQVMTLLSFQDLTGQRIKRITAALQTIEQTVVNLYVSTGLKIKAREERQETPETLKGPQESTNQQDVDDLLRQLGIG